MEAKNGIIAVGTNDGAAGAGRLFAEGLADTPLSGEDSAVPGDAGGIRTVPGGAGHPEVGFIALRKVATDGHGSSCWVQFTSVTMRDRLGLA
jgi:hypothetical protein